MVTSVMKGVTMNRRVWLSVLLTVLVIGVVAAIGYGVYQIGFDQGVAATAGETTTVIQAGHRGYGWGFFPWFIFPLFFFFLFFISESPARSEPARAHRPGARPPAVLQPGVPARCPRRRTASTRAGISTGRTTKVWRRTRRPS